MDITNLPPARTLGALLVEEARRLQNRHVPVPAWLAPFALVRRHISALPLASVSRFQRRDAEIASPSRPAFDSLLEQGASIPGSPASLRRSLLGGTARTRLAGQEGLPDAVRMPMAAGEPASGVDARIHDDEASDALARREHASAVTIGQHIYFRQGQFRPHERKGQALLAHEMVHVHAAMRPDSSWRRATTGGVQEEEQAARAVEQRVLLNGLAATPPAAGAPPGGGTDANWPGRMERLPLAPGAGTMPGTLSSPVLRPMAAAADRPLKPLAGETGSRAQPAAEGARISYQDLLRQIQIDFERGG